jgi:hypothetical protein
VATLGIGIVSSRLEENLEIEDEEQEGAVHQHILPFFLSFLFPQYFLSIRILFFNISRLEYKKILFT